MKPTGKKSRQKDGGEEKEAVAAKKSSASNLQESFQERIPGLCGFGHIRGLGIQYRILRSENEHSQLECLAAERYHP